jgi:two-component system cell cycle response regulator CtrA
MQAIVRRCKGVSQLALRVCPLELNLDSREMLVDGKVVRLTGEEYAIQELLVLRRGMIMTKEALINHLCGWMDEPRSRRVRLGSCARTWCRREPTT